MLCSALDQNVVTAAGQGPGQHKQEQQTQYSSAPLDTADHQPGDHQQRNAGCARQETNAHDPPRLSGHRNPPLPPPPPPPPPKPPPLQPPLPPPCAIASDAAFSSAASASLQPCGFGATGAATPPTGWGDPPSRGRGPIQGSPYHPPGTNTTPPGPRELNQVGGGVPTLSRWRTNDWSTPNATA